MEFIDVPLRIALGIPDSSGVSKYGEVTICIGTDVFLYASLRITNHQANAKNIIFAGMMINRFIHIKTN